MIAAERYQGIALAYGAIASDTLSEERLVRLFDFETDPLVIYSVAYPKDRARYSRIIAMRDWLLNESFQDGTYGQDIQITAA